MPPDDDVVATGNVCLLSPNLGDVLPLDITGVVSLDVCGSGGLTDALITAGSSAKGIPPTNLGFAIVCTTTVNNEGWCDCGAGGASAAKDYSACRDSVAADGDDCDTTYPIVLSDDPGSSDNGPLRSAFSGTTGTGDCTGTLATAFKTVLLSPSQKGPGRKTDVTDAEWIAQLLQCGLVRPSFVPDRTQRDLRDLTRQRTRLVQQRVTVTNRVHKVLEDANIKLASVASDALGVSGRAMIEAIIKGQEDSEVLAELARHRLRGKIPELRLALEGKVTDHHRFLLRELLDQLDYVERKIATLTERIEQSAPPSFKQCAELIDTVPGIAPHAAQAILAETGTNMGQFPSPKHFCSWAAQSPGNHESAGKRKSGKPGRGNKWLDAVLTEVAWAAARTRQTYLNAQYHRLTPRRGKKRAIGALEHSILTAIYFMVRDQVPYKDLGADHFTRINPEQQTRYHVRKLQQLGHKVDLTPLKDAA